jgi:hypothetical protein
MQLRKARVCLDCEEVHDADSCPVCASQAFAYLTQWLRVEERRKRKRLPAEGPSRPHMKRVLFGSGVLGLLAFSVVKWARSDVASHEKPEGQDTSSRRHVDHVMSKTE